MKAKRSNRLIFALIASLVVVIVFIAIYIVYLLVNPQASADVPAYLLDDDGITQIEPALEIPDFTLTDQQNEPIQLSDLDGRPSLLTFGYTHCPDVCPITLGEMRKIHDALGADSEQLNYIFISVDGERDTPAVLNTYFTSLRVGDFVRGMTGSEADLRTIAQPFGVEFIYNEVDQLGNYTVDHTAGMFLLDENQNWIRRYRYGLQHTVIADDIQQILNN